MKVKQEMILVETKIPKKNATLVLIDPKYSGTQHSNLALLDSHQTVIWWAESIPGESATYYTEVSFDDCGHIETFAYSGWLVHISAETGRIIDTVFAK